MIVVQASLFPIIFASAIRGLGRHTKEAAKYQVSAAVGAAIFPPVYYSVLKKSNPRYAMSVTLTLLAIGITYPLYLCVSKKERRRLDQSDFSEAMPDDNTQSIALQDIKVGRRQYFEVL